MGLFRKSPSSEQESGRKKVKMDPFVEEKIKAGVPIDHGWAWMCVLACHVMNMLMSGLTRSQGIFYVELVNLFEASSVDTMWVFCISGFCVNCVAPFSNSFAARFSSRQVVFVGAILVAFGFLMSNFTSSLKLMYLTYGIFIGIGFGLVYAPTITTVGYYFHQRRALANGLSVAGSSVGAFFMPHLVSFLIERYSIKGAFIIIAAIMLHLCVVASLLRPMEFYVERRRRARQLSAAAAAPGASLTAVGDAEAPRDSEQVCGRFRVLPALPALPESRLEEEEEAAAAPAGDEEEDGRPAGIRFAAAAALVPRSNGGSQRWQSMNSLHSSASGLAPDSLREEPPRTRSCLAVVMSAPGAADTSELPTLFEAGLERRVSDSDIGSAQTTLTHGGRALPIFSESALQAVRKELVRMEQNKVLKRARPTSHAFRRLLAPRLQRARALLSMPSASLVASVPDLTFASLQNLPQRWSTAHVPARPRGLRDTLLDLCKLRQKVTMGGRVRPGKGVPIIDPWVLRQPSFYFLAVGMALCVTVFGTNFMLVPSYGESLGIPKAETAAFLQYMGITDLIGRLGTGWLADLNLVPRKYLLIGFFLGEGLVCLLLPLVFCSYSGLVVFSLLLGLFAGSVVPLTAVVICDALGIRRLSSAFGMSMILFGIAAAIIPGIVGLLRDATGSWDIPYYFCGSVCILAAVLVVIDARVSRKWPIVDDDVSDSSRASAPAEEERKGDDEAGRLL